MPKVLKPFQIHKNAFVFSFLAFMFGLLLVILTLTSREPNLLRPVSIALRYSFTLVLPLVWLAFWGAFSLPGSWYKLLAFPLTLLIFAASLAGLWASGQTEAYVISGLLPWTDATGYYSGAQRLLEGDLLSAFSARRPLFAGMLAVLLSLSGRNLQISLAIFVALAGAASYLAAKEVRRTHGAIAAATLLTFLFFFYRRFGGTTMTENLGFPLGALGFAFLWAGAFQKRLPLIYFGTFVTTLALNARAGAFFVLPAIALWAGWAFRKTQRFAWRPCLLTGLAIVGGFLCNTLVFQLLAPPDAVPMANFTYSFYGLATGGSGWGQYKVDHPELLGLPPTEESPKLLALALEEIKNNPLNLVKGALIQYGYLFSNTWYSAYSYLRAENELITLLARLGAYLLAAGGIGLTFLKRKTPLYSLMLALAIGVLLSVPLAPPFDAYLMRAYAASIPVFAIFPALGLSYVLSYLYQRFRKTKPSEGVLTPSSSQTQPLASLLLAGLIFLLAIPGPLWIKYTAAAHPSPKITCSTGQEAMLVRLNPGSYVQIIKEDVLQLDWMPEFHQGRFRLNAHNLADPGAASILDDIEAPATFFTALDLISGRGIWVIANSDQVPPAPSVLGLCGQFETDPKASRFNFFYTNEVKKLTSGQ
jgi:hypothetical protein